MPFNRLAFAALAVACIGAAAAGGYLASRQNTSAPAPAASVALPTASSAPVEETEAVVNAPARKNPPSGAAAPKTQTVKPAESRTPAAANAASGPAVSSSARNNDPSASAAADRPQPLVIAAPPPQPPVASAPPPPDPSFQAPRPDDRGAVEVARAPEPPQKAYEELVVPGDSVIGLQADTPVSSERARIEDRVEARVTRDVRVHDAVAIPAGTRAIGSVTQVDRGNKFNNRARLGIRFHTLVLADGTRLPIQTETIYRNGEAPGSESSAKIGGGAAIGAIIGAIIGGGKGAAIGAGTGAGAGTAAVMSGERNAATVKPGEPITVRMTSPVTVTVEQK